MADKTNQAARNLRRSSSDRHRECSAIPELESRNRDLSETLEQQTATSEILRVIASSPMNLPPVLNVVAENAAVLCDAQNETLTF